jgi:SAM-dependent methyltransferase/ADP-ribose pyrophosphatase YjhB (NUDIX family)
MALLMQDEQVLMGKRHTYSPPFAGRWVLPGLPLREQETAEDCLARIVTAELGSESLDSDFRDTLYQEDRATGARYVSNVFEVLRWEGKLRFRARGDFEEVRWVSADEMADLPMPEQLRRWLLERLLGAEAAEPPDNRSAWNAISPAYQASRGPPADDIYWGVLCPPESELSLLGEVKGRRLLVLGCGGGQDAIALARWDAQVVGIDLSDAQVAHGRKLAEKEGLILPLVQGNVEQMPGIDSESQDIVISAQALNYVERIDRCFSEVARVLKPGGIFAFSVQHPMDACLEDDVPHSLEKGYFQVEHDWRWDFREAAVSARFRSWFRPISEWFDLLCASGFDVERILEPAPAGPPRSWELAYGDAVLEKANSVPTTIIFKARKSALSGS